MNILSEAKSNDSSNKQEELSDFYYSLAHEVLPSVVLNTPFQIKLLKPGKLVKWLWVQAFINSGLKVLPPVKGFSCKAKSKGGYEFLSFEFPTPSKITGAYMAAAVREAKCSKMRYFILESTKNSTKSKPEAFVCEWVYKGDNVMHRTYSPVVNFIDEKTFLDSIIKRLNTTYSN